MAQSVPSDIKIPFTVRRRPYFWFFILTGAAILPIFFQPGRFFLEDSLFYLQIANNFAKGLGSTFNGIALTNGYHPMWMGICAFLSFLAGNDRALLLYFVIMVHIVIFVAIGVIFCKVSPMPGWKWSLPILVAFFWGAQVIGSEAYINGLAIVIFWRLGLIRGRQVSQEVCLGLSLGLVFLARLDNAFIVAAYFISMLFSEIRAKDRNWRGLFISGAGAAIAAVPYLVVNQYYFGHLLPISGAIKSSFPHPGFNLHALGKFGAAMMLLSAATMLLVRKKGPIPFSLPLFSINVGVILQAVYNVFFTFHQTSWHWYYVSGALNAAFIAPFFAEFMKRRGSALFTAKTLRIFGLILFLAIPAAVAAKNWMQFRSSAVVWYEPEKRFDGAEPWTITLAHALDSLLSSGTRMLVFDQPGFIAYYSHLSVLASDGLTMNYEYGAYLKKKGMASYLEKESIRYLLMPNENWEDPGRVVRFTITRGPADISIHFFLPLGGDDAGIVTLPDSCMVKNLSAIKPGFALALWKLP